MRKRGSCRDEWLAPQRSMRPEMGRSRREGDCLCVPCREVQLRGLLSTENRLPMLSLLPWQSCCFHPFDSSTSTISSKFCILGALKLCSESGISLEL